MKKSELHQIIKEEISKVLNENEIRRTIEQDNYYIIKPDYALQHIKHNFIHLKSYDSADSEICLSKDELKQYLQNKDFL